MKPIEQVREAITHELKCHPEPFQAVKRGDKPFEWRKDDRDYRVGDMLWLREWDPEWQLPHLDLSEDNDPIGYTGDEIRRRVTYIIREGFGIPEGYCIMGLKDMEGQEPVGWQFFQDGEWHYGNDRIRNHRKNTEDGGYPVRDIYAHPSPSAPVDIAEVIAAGDHALLMAERCIDGAHAGPHSFLPGQYKDWKHGRHAWTTATAKHRTT